MTSATTVRPLGLLLVAGLVLAGCGGSDEDQAGGNRESVLILAAASLTDVFMALEPIFEEANPGADLQFSFGGSADLSQQIVNGSPADVFASANESQMTVVTDAGLAEGEPALFATNVLTIAVPAGNPAGITGFADVAGPDVDEVVCAPQVPCGAATEAVEESSGVMLSPVSEEPDVRSVLTKVAAGEADAGIVYVTDVQGESDVEQIEFPEAQDTTNDYPIAVLSDAPQVELARAFVGFVFSDEGQQALADAGFGAP